MSTSLVSVLIRVVCEHVVHIQLESVGCSLSVLIIHEELITELEDVTHSALAVWWIAERYAH